MQKRAVKFADDRQRQFNFAGELDFAAATDECCARISSLIKRSRYSRAQLADLATGFLRRQITEGVINDCLAPSTTKRLHLDLAICLCLLLGDNTPLNPLLALSHSRVSDKVDGAYERVGRIVEQRKRLDDDEADAWATIARGRK